MKGKGKILIGGIGLVLLLLIGMGYSQRLQLFRYLPSTSIEGYSTSDQGVMVHEETGKPFSGRLRTEYESRTEIYSYRKGLLEGLNVVYKNNKIVEVGNWKNNLQEGRFQLYSDEGVLLDDAFFVAGVRHGPTKQYYSTGGLRVEATYVNGLLEGLCTQYSESGGTEILGSYKNGEMDGSWVYYFDGGKTMLEADFAAGVCVGALFLDEDGTQMRGILDSNGMFIPEGFESDAGNLEESEPDDIMSIEKNEESPSGTSGNTLGLTIDDTYYPVPSPVRQFIDDGWQMTDTVPFFDTATDLSGYYDTIFSLFVTEDGKRILADEFTIRLFEKEGSLLELTIANQNPDGVDMPIEDCVVIGISARLERTTNFVKIEGIPLKSISQEALTSLFPDDDGWLINTSRRFEEADYIRQQIERANLYRQYVEGYFNLAGEPIGIQVYDEAPLH